MPLRARVGHPVVAFDATMSVLQLERYHIDAVDPHHLTIHARAKLDGHKDDPKYTSFIIFQCYGDGTLEASVRGFHVKVDEGVMHRKLAEEVETLMRRIHQAAYAMSGR